MCCYRSTVVYSTGTPLVCGRRSCGDVPAMVFIHVSRTAPPHSTTTTWKAPMPTTKPLISSTPFHAPSDRLPSTAGASAAVAVAHARWQAFLPLFSIMAGPVRAPKRTVPSGRITRVASCPLTRAMLDQCCDQCYCYAMLCCFLFVFFCVFSLLQFCSSP
ncbi:hypothetical protein JKP88DRAFT_227349 [Tribonema minus]|uniref:Uncharacterized protein n=1 Tax=Tribonema minus TaxID=303371 RepID=A0A835YUJ7_9STRA|nr:hypothetical protein JKP88DRAFT_227349 [Tribonema minus]